MGIFNWKKTNEEKGDGGNKMTILNTKSFKSINVKHPCRKKIFEIFPDDSFIIVLDKSGKTIVYEKNTKNTFENLREIVSLFGSEFFKHSILEDDNVPEYALLLKNHYEKETGLTIRNIYQYNDL